MGIQDRSVNEFVAAFQLQTWQFYLSNSPRIDQNDAGHLRSSVGARLVEATCPYPTPDCATCPLQTRCVWPLTFHLLPVKGVKGMNPPVPYVLSWTDTGPRLTLIGAAIQYTPLWLVAIQRALKIGLGTPRTPFTVGHIERLPTPAPPNIHSEHLGIRFLTPVQLRKKGKNLHQFDLDFFIERSFARLELLSGRSLELDDMTWTLIADHTQTAQVSRRGQHPTPVHARGFVGDIIINGPWHPILPLFMLLTRTGAGRGSPTTWGAGQIELFDPDRG